MIPLVEKRRVSRWFYRGKGFATETAALRFIVEAELKSEMLRRAYQLHTEYCIANKPNLDDDDGDFLKPFVLQAYAERFQHTPGYCDRYRRHSTICPCRTSATYNAMFEVVGHTFDYAVCRVAKAEYLEKRVAELRAAGVVKVKQ